eukprot:TRINITY_DN41897_c9_g1_i1.p1 TRINITY_DN41897_c9_g1~~TRINITY_DN41897_c9_g1_i1.p1  ORF type:complete len:1052 (-),score=124.97 TRINITY_DN41897_c9_g1_i1:19009-22164(-)
MEHIKKRAAELEALQRKPERTRNICVLAHVDHGSFHIPDTIGKTTLSDSLISHNHIISRKQAGQILLLDSREDEQERLITMKASSIAIIYRPPNEVEKHLVNLIDSPGHVDFSFEVSSALRLSDGAVVLVDALEGVCQQTVTVIRQAWEERVKMCLVINKVDRLPFHLSMNPVDGYNHIKGILQQVNVEISSLISMEINLMIANDPNVGKSREELIGKMEEEYYFDPEKGNVAFASALDCWAFTMDSYAEFLAPKIGIDKALLRKHLWSDYYYSPSQKAFFPLDPESTAKKPAFVTFVLDPLWKEYSRLFTLRDTPDTSRYKETRGKIKEKLSKQMPMDLCILSLVCKHLPSPKTAQKYRLPTLCPALYDPSTAASAELTKIRNAIESVDSSEEAPVVIYVSKMMGIDRVQISDLKDIYLAEIAEKSPGDRLALIAFSRVFSGNLAKGKTVYVMGPKHNKEKGIMDIHEVHIEHLYNFMGMHLEVCDTLLAGSVGGIGGLDSFLYKVGTISSTSECPTFTPLTNKSKPIVKVAVEAEKLGDMEKLSEGLRKLNRAEPSVEVYLTDSGEYILCACGEVHLQKCLKDLKDEYAKVSFKVSEHIVNFRETILLRYLKPEKPAKTNGEKELPPEPKAILIHPVQIFTEMEKKEEEKKIVDKTSTLYLEKIRYLKVTKQKGLAFDITPNGRCRIFIRAIGLDFGVTKWLENKRNVLKQIAAQKLTAEQLKEFVKQFKGTLEAHSTPRKIINLILNYLLSFGPKKYGPNMVISPFLQASQSLLFVPSEGSPTAPKYHRIIPEGLLQHISFEDLHKSIVTGFELASLSGPLCEERMVGACFLIEAIEYIDVKLEYDPYGPFSGQVMSTTREICRRAFMNADPRIVEGLYMCTMQVSSGTLGKIYSVIHKRRGRVVSEELLPETDVFTVRVLIPVMESFGFAEEIRERGEGITDPQMTFSHWEIINEDPFFVPKTMAEMEEFGQQVQPPTLAKIIIDKVRKRKGLPTEVKLVVKADKQRTLTKMKQQGVNNTWVQCVNELQCISYYRLMYIEISINMAK